MSIQAILDLAEAQGILVGLSEFGQITIDTSSAKLSQNNACKWVMHIHYHYKGIEECLRGDTGNQYRESFAMDRAKVWLMYLADQAKANPMVRKS